jgi:hypothetical protein
MTTSFLRQRQRYSRAIFILRCPVCEKTEERRGRDCMALVVCPQCDEPMKIDAYRIEPGRLH